jgi:type IV pilus assembly protein PilE
LVEVAIVLVVAGLLAGIAWPSYSDAVRRGRRADATDAILKVLQAQERWQANTGSYAADLSTLGAAASSPKGYYQLAVSSADRHGFTLTANALSTASQSGDTACATLTVTVLRGQATHAPATCWAH